MRFESRTWFILSLLLFAAAIYFWKRGNEYQLQKMKAAPPATQQQRGGASFGGGNQPNQPAPSRLMSQVGAIRAAMGSQTPAPVPATVPVASVKVPTSTTNGAPHRISNSGQTIEELSRVETAILLRNAFVDTANGTSLPIPAHLRAEGDPGAYIVQARGPIQQSFRDRLQQAGGSIVSYIPNNAYLVQVTAEGAQKLAESPETQAVLPYDPYYKLETKLLGLAVEKKPLPADQWLRVTAFPGQTESATQGVTALGGEVLDQERTPFGEQLVVKALPDSLPAIAGLAAVQIIEPSRQRELLADQTRVRIGIASTGASTTNYLNLTGTNVMVNINDSGVDATHPDLKGHVLGDTDQALTDPFSHGTHIAGVLAGNGSQSATVSGAPAGSDTNANFRGIAPSAQLFSVPFVANPEVNRWLNDSYLQETAARTNLTMSRRRTGPMVSNNSWGYTGANEYDSSSARFDAAVRDALPEDSGSQPMIYVFAAGNSGEGTDQGLGGQSDTIPSPGNAKNVITVGATETLRYITNGVVVTNVDGTLSTNSVFLGMTDSIDEVAAFSSRGNVGIGTEGLFGRFKPDVVAPGSFLVSTRSKDWKLENQVDTNSPQYEILKELNEPLQPYYRFESGTSQAAPVASGMLALMQEFFEQRLQGPLRRTNSPALMKALLINGARSLGPTYSLEVKNSKNFQGWGMLNLTNSIPATLSSGPETRWPVRMIDQNPTNSLATGQSRSWNLNLSTNVELLPLRVTLVWTDPPGNPTAAIKLVNDLDLVVSNKLTGESWYGNDIRTDSDYNYTTFPDEEKPSDVVNNVENVFIREPGTNDLVITVTAKRVNVAAQPEFNRATGRYNDVVQDFALVVSTDDTTVTNAFTLTSVAPPPPLAVMATPVTNGVPLMNERVGANTSLSSSRQGITNQWNFYVFTNLFVTNDVSSMTNGTNVAFVVFLPPNLAQPRNNAADVDLYVSRDPSLVTLNPTAVDAAWKSVTRGGTEYVVFTNANLGEVYYIGVKAEDQQGGEYGFIALSSDTPFEQLQDGARILNGMPVPQNIPDGTPNNPGRSTIIAIGITPATVQRVVVTNVLTHENVGDLSISLTHEQTSVVLHNHTANNGFPTVTNGYFVYDDQSFDSTFGARRSDGPGTLNEFAGMLSSGVWLMNVVDNAPGQTGRVESVTLRIDPFQENDLAAAGAKGIDGTVGPGGYTCYYFDVPPEATNLVLSLSQMTGPLEVFLAHGALPSTNYYDKMELISPPGGMITLGAEDEPTPLASGRYFVCLHNPGQTLVRFHIAVTFELGVGLDYKRTLTGTNVIAIVDGGVITSTVNIPVDKQVADAQVSVLVQHPRSADLVMHLISPQGKRVLLAENRGGPDSHGYGEVVDTNLSYTVFTEDTNLFGTLAPIKFALPPWTNLIASTNPPTFSDSFESATPGLYTNGQTFAGWTVTQGNVLVHSLGNALGVNAREGTNFVELDTTKSPASIVTTFGTVPGKTYSLSFYYYRNPGAPVQGAHALGVYYGPPKDPRGFSKFIQVSSYGWESTNIIFTAATATTELELGSLTAAGPLLDNITVGDVVAGTNVYVMPEEPLSLLKGVRALGDWTLEIADTRLGPSGSKGALLGWELQLKYGNPPDRALTLTNGVTVSGLVSGPTTNFFVVDVCESSRVAFATLTGAYDRLRLLVDRDGFPTGNSELDDFFPLTNNLAISEALDIGVAAFALDSDPHQPAPLQPGKQLFFAVQNLFPDETNTFDLQVTFDNDTCNGERPVIRLENDVPYTNVVAPSASLFDYYVFNVSPTALQAEFEVRPLNGDVGMVLSYGLPLPDLANWQYKSDLPGITNELIVLTNSSVPVALQSGDWYIGVYNNSTNPVVYDVRASEVLDTNLNVVLLTNNVPLDYDILQGSMLTNFFLFKVPDPYPGVKFELYNLNANADLLISYNGLPTTNSYLLSNSASPAQPITIEIRTNSSLRIPDMRGNWMLAVIPRDPTNLTFTLRASYILGTTNQPPSTNRVFDPVISVVGTNLCFSWDTTPGLTYELQGVHDLTETNWTTIYGPVTATNTTMNYCTPLPSEYSFFRVLERGGAQPPPPPSSVIDPSLDISSTNVCLSWPSTIGSSYQVQGKEFISDPAWTNIGPAIVATTTNTLYCVPLPTPYHFFQVLENGGSTNPPPPGGETFIDPQLSFGTNGLCLTWPSQAGGQYDVQGKLGVADPAWTNLAAVTATGALTTYCLPTNTPYHFFQIVGHTGPTTPTGPNPVSLHSPVVLPNGSLQFMLDAVPGTAYEVQVTTNLRPVIQWTTLTNVTPTSVTITITDPVKLGTGGARFYRVMRR